MVSALSLDLIFYCIVIQCIICFIPSETIGFTLRLIPRFSPESPFYPGNLTFEEKVARAIELSMSQARYIDLTSAQGSISSNNIRLIVGPDRYYYTTEVDLGTPKSTQSLLFSTRTNLLWTQCKPCIHCYNQPMPIFAPNESSSYSKVPCDDPVCRGNPDYKCINGQCKYKVSFGEVSYRRGAVSEGLVSRETFTFESNKGRPTVVPKIVFGCGNNNRGFNFDQHKISGVIGLNNGRNSFITQLIHKIQGRFSYCLVYSQGEVTAKSLLRFGEDAVLKSRRGIQTVDIVKSPTDFGNYYVKLIDVSVGNKRIGFPPGTFELKSGGEGGCLIDTGAPNVLFPTRPYDVVMKEFDKHFMSHRLERVYNVTEGLNYCYKHNPQFRAYASMTLHFQNANYVVEPTYQYFHFKEKRCFCVAVLVNPGFSQKTVIGGWQQQDMRFLYDLKKGVIRFVPENCAADH